MAGKAQISFSYNIENQREFSRSINAAIKKVKDLSIPFEQIANDFFKSRRAIFKLKSPGQYPDFKNGRNGPYATKKEELVGFKYPLLKFSGRLEDSVTDKSAQEAIYQNDGKTLTMGSSVPYLRFHQSDLPRKKLPMRKVIFFGPEAPRFAKGALSGFTGRALDTLNAYVARETGESFPGDPVISVDSKGVNKVKKSEIK